MSGMLGQTGTRSGILLGDPPSFALNGDVQSSSTVWPPPPLDLKTPVTDYSKFYVGNGIILNASSNYVTLCYAGTYHIWLDVRHDVGGGQATTATTLNFVYVKEGPAAFTNTATYDYSISIASANGTRSQEDGFINTVGSAVQYFKAGTHIWPGGFNRANQSNGLRCFMFHGIMLK